MSLSLSRPALRQAAGVLACGPALVALGGCHHGSSPLRASSPAERVTIGHGQQANDEALRRRFPGVDVMRTPSGGVAIRMISGLAAGGPPLYVIDGAPVLVDPSRGFDWLKPEDIERINVLKDPAETAVYGPRGVNGVILITTKQVEALRKRGP
ncbi:MAG: TonB-dependent receptor plug domain-containing protein [Gemmatimonadaceae bacterium]